jgi:hypothetical protein
MFDDNPLIAFDDKRQRLLIEYIASDLLSISRAIISIMFDVVIISLAHDIRSTDKYD